MKWELSDELAYEVALCSMLDIVENVMDGEKVNLTQEQLMTIEGILHKHQPELGKDFTVMLRICDVVEGETH